MTDKQSQHERDFDYLFETLQNHAYDLYDCISSVEKLLQGVDNGTKAHQYFFTMWSVLFTLKEALQEVSTLRAEVQNLRARQILTEFQLADLRECLAKKP